MYLIPWSLKIDHDDLQLKQKQQTTTIRDVCPNIVTLKELQELRFSHSLSLPLVFQK